MSLTEVLESVRELSATEQADVRRLLDEINAANRLERFRNLRGSASDDNSSPLTFEDFQRERRAMWQGITGQNSEN